MKRIAIAASLIAGLCAAGSAHATNTAFAPRGGVELGQLVAQDVPEVGIKQVRARGGCGCAAGAVSAPEAIGAATGALILGLALVIPRRRPSARQARRR